MEKRKYSFAPACGEKPLFLLLGSLPGDESLRQVQYYAHPRNVFWDIMEELWKIPRQLPYEERLTALQKYKIALWDVVGSGARPGSLDAKIRQETPNPIEDFLTDHPSIRRLGCNGATSFRLLHRYFPSLAEQFEIIKLPSTSPAAAMFTFEEKLAAYRTFFIMPSSSSTDEVAKHSTVSAAP